MRTVLLGKGKKLPSICEQIEVPEQPIAAGVTTLHLRDELLDRTFAPR